MRFISSSPLKAFLSTAKHTLANYNATRAEPSSLTFVVGNESADLDSLCSAVVLAYMLTYFSNRLYIPLSNLPRAMLSVRPELRVVVPFSLTPDDFITLTDLPSPLPQAQHTRWILVDHNAPTGELGRVYGERLFGCIDHHKEEGRVPMGPSKDEGIEHEPRIVQEAGSCASLVTAWAQQRQRQAVPEPQLLSTFARETQQELPPVWDAELAKMALGPILIDTTCLKSTKTMPVDIAAVQFLEQVITEQQPQGAAYDRAAFFHEITAAKENLDPFTLTQILLKDYKQWDSPQDPSLEPCNLGIASTVRPVAYLLGRADSVSTFLSTIQEIMHERDLSIFALMTTSRSEGVFKRELMVWGLGYKGVQAAQRFEAEASKKLGLERSTKEKLDVDTAESFVKEHHPKKVSWRRFWKQLNVGYSRKQVAPLLREAIKQNENSRL